MYKIIIGAAVFLVIFILFLRYCAGNGKTYTKHEVDLILRQQDSAKVAYEDTIEFVRGQAELQLEANLAHTDRIVDLEKDIDSLIKKHNVTKKKITPWFDTSGVAMTIVPNEYLDECNMCFAVLEKYKYENVALRFERDSYDSLMRNQNEINEARIKELEGEKMTFNKLFNDCAIKLDSKPGVTRKVKAGMMGMMDYRFSPNGIGPGLIYEDKKFNEFGGHVLFTSAGNVYLLHIAKTISFKRKK